MTFAIGLTLLLSSAGADAGAQVMWEAPLECPDARWFEARVGDYLGRALAEEPGIELTGRVHRRGAGFELELATRIDGVAEHQRLRHHECAALVELAASVAAIAIDPLLLTDSVPARAPVMAVNAWASDTRASPPRTLVQAPGTPTRAVPVRRPSTRPTRPQLQADRPADPLDHRPGPATSAIESELPATTARPATQRSLEPLLVELYADPSSTGEIDEPAPLPEPGNRLLLGASGGLALNLFPNLAPMVRVGLGLDRSIRRVGVRAELVGGAVLAGRFRSEDGSTGGDLLAWDVGVRPCAVPRWGLVDLRVCAAVGAGQIRARGVGVQPLLRRAHPWVWTAIELGLAFEVQTHVALVLDVGAQANLARPNFSVTGPDASYLTPIVGGRAGLGIELRFF